MSRFEVNLPKQPYIPWSLWLALITWAFFSIGISQATTSFTYVAVILIALWLLALLAWGLEKKRELQGLLIRVLSVLICIACAGIRLYMYKQWYETSYSLLFHTPISTITWKIDGDASLTKDGNYNVEAIGSIDDSETIRAILITDYEYRRGQSVKGVGKATKLSSSSYDQRLTLRGICGKVILLDILKEGTNESLLSPLFAWRQDVLESIDYSRSFGRSLIAALLCNMKQGLNQRHTRQLLAHAGISHLVAVSGTHLSLIAYATHCALKRLRIPSYISRICIIFLICFFIVLCGFPPSAVRAGIMTTLALCAQNIKRRSHALSSISLALIFMLAFQPEVSHDLGFTLSFIAVITLSIYGPYARYLFEQAHFLSLSDVCHRFFKTKRSAQVVRGISETVVITMLVQITTLPILRMSNGELAIAGPISNICFNPFIMIGMPLGLMFVLSARLPIFGQIVGTLVDVLGKIFYALLNSVQSIPTLQITSEFANLVYILILMILGIYILVMWPKRTRKHARFSIIVITLAVMAPCFIH